MSFPENYAKLERDLAEARKQRDEFEQQKLRLGEEKRLAEHRAGTAETDLAAAQEEVTAANRRVSEMQKRVDLFQVTEQNLVAETGRAKKLGRELIETRKHLLDETNKRQEAEKKAGELTQVLRTRETEFTRARELLAAFETRARANALIESA